MSCSVRKLSEAGHNNVTILDASYGNLSQHRPMGHQARSFSAGVAHTGPSPPLESDTKERARSSRHTLAPSAQQGFCDNPHPPLEFVFTFRRATRAPDGVPSRHAAVGGAALQRKGTASEGRPA